MTATRPGVCISRSGTLFRTGAQAGWNCGSILKVSVVSSLGSWSNSIQFVALDGCSCCAAPR